MLNQTKPCCWKTEFNPSSSAALEASVIEILPEGTKPTPEEATENQELTIPASFVDPTVDPQSYVDRYNSDMDFKEWFDENFSEYESIYQAVGLSEDETNSSSN